jgi:hypothetical protein
VGQGVQQSRFACLPRGVDDKVLLCLHQTRNIVVQIPERIHHVVMLRVAQAGRVEEAFHGAKIGVLREKGEDCEAEPSIISLFAPDEILCGVIANFKNALNLVQNTFSLLRACLKLYFLPI